MAAPIYNPIIPCVHPIPGGLYPGRMVRVQGNIPPGAQRFAINFQCGPNTDPRDDIALHLNFRFVEMCVVRNHLTSMDWGVEDTSGGMPLTRGEGFEALILCEPQSFKVALNGIHFCEFLHRVPFQRISHLTVDGDVHIQFIGFEGAQPPPQQMYMVNQTPYNQYRQPVYNQYQQRSEPPTYGAYGAPPPAYGTPGYGAPQGFAPGPNAPVGGYATPYGAPQQRRGIGTGAAVGMGVGALAAGGLAGYALGGGFSSNDSPTTEIGYQDYPNPMSVNVEEENKPVEEPQDDDYLESTDNNDGQEVTENPANPEEENPGDDDYLENNENQDNVEQEDIPAEAEEPKEEETPADDDYLENTENRDDVDDRENEIPAYEEEAPADADDDYLDNDE